MGRDSMKLKGNMEFKFVISLIFAILVAIFAIQNAGNVEIRFFYGQFFISQAVVILASTIVGAIIVFLLGLIKEIRKNMKIKQLSKEIEILTMEKNELQAELDNLNKVSIIEEDSEVIEEDKLS